MDAIRKKMQSMKVVFNTKNLIFTFFSRLKQMIFTARLRNMKMLLRKLIAKVILMKRLSGTWARRCRSTRPRWRKPWSS